MKRWLLVSALILCPAASFAQTAIPTCGGTPFQACGGDLVGTWAYAGIDCMDLPDFSAQFGPGCTGVTTDVAADVNGQMTFNADGTWASHEVSSMAMTMTVPASCLPQGVTCDALGNPQATVATLADGSCQVTMNQSKTEDEAGTYVVNGATATLTDGADPTDVDNANFCINGDTATVELIDDTGIRGIITNTRVQ